MSEEKTEYQLSAGAVVGLTMQALNSVGVENGSARESAAKRRLWYMLDRSVRDGDYDIDEVKDSLSAQFSDVLKAIDVPSQKALFVLDVLDDEIEHNFGYER